MAFLGKILLYVLAGSMALTTLSMLTRLSGDGTEVLPGLLVSGTVAALLAYWASRIGRTGSGSTDKKIAAMTAETESWLASTKELGKVPAPALGGVMVPKGQKALLGEPSALYEMKSERLTGYLGTRVKAGSLPIYIGGSRAKTQKTLKESSAGHVVLTDQAVMFVGHMRTMTAQLNDVVGMTPTLDSIALNLSTRQEPMVIAVANPVLWYTVIRALSAGEITVNS